MIMAQIILYLRQKARHRKAVFLLSFILFLFLFTQMALNFTLIMGDIYHYINPNLSIGCHSHQGPSLPDISDENPTKESSIFFLETSCNSFIQGKISIKARQACAVESAARMNPNREIYLLFASPGVITDQGTESDRFLTTLHSYPNVKIHHINIGRYFTNTPVENLWKKRIISRSWYAQSHISDVLRYLTLWKYGGIYLDLDVVVIKSLEDIPLNYAGAESSNNVAAGVLSFDYTGKGHKYAEICLNDLKDNFAVWNWGYNGPGTITRLLKTLCGVSSTEEMTNHHCGGFKVYPPRTFYPVPYWNWSMYFDEALNEEVFEWSAKSRAIHVWNKITEDTKIPLNSEVAYLQYAKKYCPRVIEQCDHHF